MTATKAQVVSASPVTHRQSEHRFFAWLAGSIVILVFVGFSLTYYLHSLFKTPKLSMFLHVHGAVMTSWIALFAVQTFLVASNRTRIHRALGIFGAGYAALVVVMGCTATVLAARREVLAHSQFVSSFLTVLALELTQMLLFASLVASGVWMRNRAGYHKRLLLLATFCMLPNPMVRLFVWAGLGGNIVILSFCASLVVAVVLLDSMRNRRLHPAFGFGATITIAFLHLAYFGSRTVRRTLCSRHGVNMKKVPLISLAVLNCTIFIAGANAQSLTSSPKPSAEIAGLTKALEGKWSLSVNFEPSYSAMNGLVNSGEEIWRPGPGGFTLLEEEHLRMPEGDLFRLGIVWWNTADKAFQGMDCQNLLPYTCDVKGAQNDIAMNWDGKQFVIDEMETSKSGKKSMWHEVWSDITPTSFTQTGEYGQPGGPRKRLFTIHATKVANSQIKNNQPQSNDTGPAPEMQSLEKALNGNWSTTYEFAPGGISPTGGTGTGEENWRTGPGGYVLMEEEHVRAPSQEMFLIAFHWWDKTTNSLRGMLCNNSGPAACDFSTYSNSSLKWDGKQLTIDLDFPQGGKKMTWHEVWSGITATSFTQTGDMGEVGGPLKRAITIHGTKLASDAASQRKAQ